MVDTRATRTHAESAQATVDVWDKLVDLMPTGKETIISARDLADTLGYTRGEFRRRLQAFVGLGLVKMHLTYEWQKAISHYTVLKTKEDGRKILIDFFRSGHFLREFEGASKQPGYRKNGTTPKESFTEAAPTAVRYEGEEPKEAIVGADAPAPMEALRAIRKDDVAALIEATKQYVNRKTAVVEKFEELEALGIKIDRDKVMAGIEVSEDPYFEGITQVLPYIAELEAKVAQMSDWKQELTEKRREVGQMRDMYNREKDANKRLSERMAQLRQSLGEATPYAANSN